MIFILLFAITSFTLTNAAQERNILWKVFTENNGTANLLESGVWRNNIKLNVKNNLDGVPLNPKQAIINNANTSVSHGWPSLLVTEFLEFVQNGNRNHYEASRANRRNKLLLLVIAELLENNGHYMNEILNGLWLLLEESTWVLPAHMYLQKDNHGLPNPNQNVIDLGVAGTAPLVAWIRLLLGEKLQKVSPIILQRIDYEMNRRVIRPYLDNNFGWMGLNGEKVNNWNIYINAKLLKTVLIAVDNSSLRNEMITKLVKSADKFVNAYPNDGGCDEGPSYWGMAGGELISFMDTLSSAFKTRLNWSAYEIVHSIGSYIYKMHIDGNKFVNFADASPFLIPDRDHVLMYGTLFNDELLTQFASYLHQLSDPHHDNSFISSAANNGDFSSFNEQINSSLLLSSIAAKAPQLGEAWFPDLQVIALRSQQSTAKGLFMSAKAGHNDESHNHNDVGNFVLYADGKPVIIDVGVGTYTAQTFSSDRYKLWNMQSQWHNCPTINGVQQHEGVNYKAHNVSYKSNTNGGQFEADISGAYPTEAQVKSWVRVFEFNKTVNQLKISENYQLAQWKEAFKVHFITALTANATTDGQITFTSDNVTVLMCFDTNLFNFEIDKKTNDDSRIINSWGDHINRISLVAKHSDLSGQFSTLFQLI